MRITFLGKGGSGKTSISTSFIKYLNRHQCPVVAIDADINVHLGQALVMKEKTLCDKELEIMDYFEGNRVTPDDEPSIIGSTPPAMTSKFVRPKLDDKFFKKYATFKENIALLTVGTYKNDVLGSSCYHGMLASLIMFYNRMLDNKKFYIVTDPTAGIDSVGTSMYQISDLNIFVVEPTKKSIDVFMKFLEITKDSYVPTYCVINKVESQNDIDFVKSIIHEKYIVAEYWKSQELKDFEQGDFSAVDKFSTNNELANEKIKILLDKQEKQWNEYYAQSLLIYINDASTWYSKYFNRDLTEYIDKEFTYDKVIND